MYITPEERAEYSELVAKYAMAAEFLKDNGPSYLHAFAVDEWKKRHRWDPPKWRWFALPGDPIQIRDGRVVCRGCGTFRDDDGRGGTPLTGSGTHVPGYCEYAGRELEPRELYGNRPLYRLIADSHTHDVPMYRHEILNAYNPIGRGEHYTETPAPEGFVVAKWPALTSYRDSIDVHILAARSDELGSCWMVYSHNVADSSWSETVETIPAGIRIWAQFCPAT